MLQTDYVIGSPLNHQDPFIQRHGSQLTANELPPFRLPFTSRRGIRLAYSFPGPARGNFLGKIHNQTTVFDADREIPTLESTKNAGNSVNLVSGVIRLSFSFTFLFFSQIFLLNYLFTDSVNNIIYFFCYNKLFY